MKHETQVGTAGISAVSFFSLFFYRRNFSSFCVVPCFRRPQVVTIAFLCPDSIQ
uniref:Uncharacterized protein n=1 Tax=Rhizophora mucronata TaxID=61149 RepID=A0A2P2NKJ1_RHIMU